MFQEEKSIFTLTYIFYTYIDKIYYQIHNSVYKEKKLDKKKNPELKLATHIFWDHKNKMKSPNYFDTTEWFQIKKL